VNLQTSEVEQDEVDRRVYGDAVTDSWSVDGWSGREGPQVLARYEPFVLFAHIRYTFDAGAIFSASGARPSVAITPFETDARDVRTTAGAPTFEVDPGLLAVPFAARVSIVWVDKPADARGVIDYTLTTYAPNRTPGPRRGAPPFGDVPAVPVLGADRWHVTRWLEDTRTIQVPRWASRFRVSDSAYGVRCALYGGAVVLPAPFAAPASLAGSPDLRIDVLAPLVTVNPNRIPVEFYV